MTTLGPLAEVTCVQGDAFAISGPAGDMSPGGDHGFYVRDTRFLDRLEVSLDGAPPRHLSDDTLGGHQAVFHGFVPPSADQAVDPTLMVARRRVVAGGLREELDLHNAADGDVTVEVAVRAGTDFAYIFDVKHGRVLAAAEPTHRDDTLAFHHDGGPQTTVLAMRGAHPVGDCLRRRVTVPGRGQVRLTVEVTVTDLHGTFSPAEHPSPPPPPARLGSGIEIACSDARFSRLLRRSRTDLASLVLDDPDGPGDRFAAAGSPWFLTLFGRDALWTALMALPFDLDLARGTLRTLARRQGTRVDHETEEEPGKILHEVRHGALAHRGDLPANYYGSVDATPLFVVLAHEAWRFGLPDHEVGNLLPHVEAALGWMRDTGDPDGDGFLEYVRHGERGLANQGWKDSHDGIRFADGRIAEAPIALVEVQGYAFAAAIAGANLLEHFDRPGVAAWRAWADDLRDRLRERLWVSDGRGAYPAVALDRRKDAVDSVASNMGHLLFTGILDADESALVAGRLSADDMASGWGLRTMSATGGGFNPLSYHCGTVWPHDTAIAIWGLARSGQDRAATTLIDGLVSASPSFGHRLPELFAGLSRADSARPVPYPAACQPQAWAAGGALLILRAVLGLEVDVPAGRLSLRPLTPRPFDRLSVRGIPLAGGTVDVEVRPGQPPTVELHGVDLHIDLSRQPRGAPASDAG